MLSLYNYGDKAVQLEDGQRIAQFMIIPRPKLELVQVEDNDEFKSGDRGGGIGSTGK
jgi:dUTPase